MAADSTGRRILAERPRVVVGGRGLVTCGAFATGFDGAELIVRGCRILQWSIHGHCRLIPLAGHMQDLWEIETSGPTTGECFAAKPSVINA